MSKFDLAFKFAPALRGASLAVCFIAGMLVHPTSHTSTGSWSVLSFATPSAHATCFFNGVKRPDLADRDCLEAQKTGCVRSMLTDAQYTACLTDFSQKKRNGGVCILNGKVRSEFNATDCAEAKATGCVRRFLTDIDYQKCINHFQ
jgi:hypothetical protein